MLRTLVSFYIDIKIMHVMIIDTVKPCSSQIIMLCEIRGELLSGGVVGPRGVG